MRGVRLKEIRRDFDPSLIVRELPCESLPGRGGGYTNIDTKAYTSCSKRVEWIAGRIK
jgi:hypothetical protein